MSSAALQHQVDVARGKIPANMPRSGRWPTVRERHLQEHPACAVCGGTKKVEVHHMHPFHLHPDLELDPENLITLCEDDDDGVNCHLLFGHLGDFKSFNETVAADAALWNQKISTRPHGEPAGPTNPEEP